jgi:hybrid cluster-associated redox disulfide protein
MITKEMGIIDIVNQYPQTVPVFQDYGMGCIGCMAARFENLAQGAAAHGIDVDSIVEDLNAAIQ